MSLSNRELSEDVWAGIVREARTTQNADAAVALIRLALDKVKEQDHHKAGTWVDCTQCRAYFEQDMEGAAVAGKLQVQINEMRKFVQCSSITVAEAAQFFRVFGGIKPAHQL